MGHSWCIVCPRLSSGTYEWHEMAGSSAWNYNSSGCHYSGQSNRTIVFEQSRATHLRRKGNVQQLTCCGDNTLLSSNYYYIPPLSSSSTRSINDGLTTWNSPIRSSVSVLFLLLSSGRANMVHSDLTGPRNLNVYHKFLLVIGLDHHARTQVTYRL